MSIKLKTATAEEFCTKVTDGTHDSPKQVEHGKLLVTSKNITSGRLDLEKSYSISIDDFNEVNKRSKVDVNDILLSMIGTVGEACLITEEPDFAIKNVGLLKNEDPVKAKWLYLYLSSPTTKHLIHERTRGTTQQYLPLGEIRKFPIIFPDDSKYMKKVTELMYCFIDKIELNRKMNETLEEMARAIFKSWFVDFDPVHAKARGEKPAGMPDEIADLFPSEFVHSDQLNKPIPKGWDVLPFANLLKHTVGGDWGKEEKDSKHTVCSIIIRGTDMPSLKNGERSKAPLRWVEENKLKSRKLEPYDIVIEISGGSPTQPTGRSLLITPNILGRLGAVVEPASFCRKFCAMDEYVGLFAYFYLDYIYSIGKTWDYQNQSTGISNFQTTVFLEKEFLTLPNKALLEYFFEYIEPITDKMTSNESIKLAELRDSLLPKLISGEIEV